MEIKRKRKSIFGGKPLKTKFYARGPDNTIKVTIEISRKIANHIRSPHTFCDGCGESETVLNKVQAEVDKALQKPTRRHKK